MPRTTKPFLGRKRGILILAARRQLCLVQQAESLSKCTSPRDMRPARTPFLSAVGRVSQQVSSPRGALPHRSSSMRIAGVLVSHHNSDDREVNSDQGVVLDRAFPVEYPRLIYPTSAYRLNVYRVASTDSVQWEPLPAVRRSSESSRSTGILFTHLYSHDFWWNMIQAHLLAEARSSATLHHVADGVGVSLSSPRLSSHTASACARSCASGNSVSFS